MAYVADHQYFKDAIQGNNDASKIVNLSGTGGGTLQKTDLSSTVPGTGDVGATAPAPAPQPPVDSLGFGPGDGDLQSRLFQPVDTGLQTGQEGLGGAVLAFDQAAGTPRTWEGIGGAGVTENFLNTGEGKDQVDDYVSAAYEGPQSLDFSPDQDLRTRADALANSSGMTSLIQASDPGYTPGAARFDAKAMWQDPGYRKEADAYKMEVDQYFQDITKERERAEAHAATRTEQESGIREAATNYIPEARLGKLGEVDEEVAARNASNRAVYDEFGNIMADGVVDEQEQKDNGLWTSVSETSAQSDQLRAEIDAKYEDIAHIEPGERTSDWKGHELTTFTVGDETFSINDMYRGDMPAAAAEAWGVPAKAQQRKLADRLRARQRELEGAFSGRSFRDERYDDAFPNYNLENGPYQHRSLLGFGQGERQYSAYDPLYNQDILQQPTAQMPDASGFLSGPEENLSEGSTHTATRENTATPEQRAYLDRAESVMAELKGLSDAGLTFEAARIGADYEGFLDAQEAAIAERERLGEEADETWVDQVQAARTAYTRAKRNETWGTVMTVVGGVFGGPIFWAGGATAGAAGGQLL